ncbi:MAG: type II toxin-antitoxin system VapB family antitoxin [Opitutales bacterium]|nr:type II toxin-antitoxin system VapB family antitoxin [Opitutales bacterium]
MKMTMHIDEALLDRVIAHYGYSSKTEAVDSALRELDRKARYRAVVSEDWGMTPEEIKAGVAEDYDVLATRAVAEPRSRYGKAKEEV